MAKRRKKYRALRKRGTCNGAAWRCQRGACYALLGERRYRRGVLLRVECKGRGRTCKVEIIRGMRIMQHTTRKTMAEAKAWACKYGKEWV